MRRWWKRKSWRIFKENYRKEKQKQQQQNQIKIFSPPHPLTIPKSPAFASKLLEKSKSKSKPNIQQQQQPSSKITAVSTKVNL